MSGGIRNATSRLETRCARSSSAHNDESMAFRNLHCDKGQSKGSW